MFSTQDGILMARGELSGKNRITEQFYNGPRFQRFRFWENLFLRFVGGRAGARRQILRCLPPLEGRSLLEVGIGDGDNVALLPAGVEVTGIDIALRRLIHCRDRFADRAPTLALAEAEHNPFDSNTFDAVLCVGGLNFFSDPAAALREMARVARPGAPIVVADEIPDLYRYGWGHRIGIPALDRWLARRWLGEEFAAIALENDLDIERLGRETLGDAQVYRIWRGYGYCLVGTA